MGRERDGAVLLTFARRGEEEAIREALRHLRSELPGRQVAAVGTLVSAPVLRELGAEEVIVYGGGAGARAVVRELRGRAPAAVGIVYGGPGFSGHLKLELVALASAAGRIYQFLEDTRARRVGRGRLLASVCGKLARVPLCLAVGAAACGTALCWLRLRQLMAGGKRAGRA
ncbi:MAG: hypothetical protein JSV79_13135 [Armatimonadota bacterium]|nr:MAG: hypothetical protein JSV79_13135 [Armatimonadota bacterium]